MLRPRILRSLAVYGASVPTLAAPPVVAGATIYMPSHLAVRILGGRHPVDGVDAFDTQQTAGIRTAISDDSGV